MPTKAELQAVILELEAEVEELRRSPSGAYGALVAALPAQSERTPWVAARAEVALALAKELDAIVGASPASWSGPPPNVSAIAKELRAAIEALEDELADSDQAGFFDGVDVPS